MDTFIIPQEAGKVLSAKKSHFPIFLPLLDEASDFLLKFTHGVYQSQF